MMKKEMKYKKSDQQIFDYVQRVRKVIEETGSIPPDMQTLKATR